MVTAPKLVLGNEFDLNAPYYTLYRVVAYGKNVKSHCFAEPDAPAYSTNGVVVSPWGQCLRNLFG